MLRDTGESLLLMHELEYAAGDDNPEVLRWLLLASDWGSARLGLAPLPGGAGLFAACALPAHRLGAQRADVGRRAGPPARRGLRRAGRRMGVEIAFFAVIVVGYLFVVVRIWRGEGHWESEPPAFWPFGERAWQGTGRAFPVEGFCVLLLIGGGIAADVIGGDNGATTSR